MKTTITKLRNIYIDTPVWVYIGVSLLILGPLLLPGFVLTLDMVFTPRLRLPPDVTSSYLLQILLYVLDWLLPADIIQKLLLISILTLTGLGGFRLAQQFGVEEKTALYTAGLFYMVNPYTYARFIAGQYYLLFGYALLPWFVRAIVRFALQPAWRTALRVVVWATAISIVSIHSVLPALIVAILVWGGYGWRWRRDRQRLLGLVKYSLAIVGILVLAASYWLVPVVTGSGAQAQLIGNFTDDDREAFATSGSTTAARIGNVVRLQGFWAERYGLFVLPQDVWPAAMWTLFIVLLLGLVLAGVWTLWRQKRRAELVLLSTIMVIGVLLAAGIGIDELSGRISLLEGYREPHKLAMLTALSYAMLAAISVAAALRLVARRKWETVGGVSALVALALPFLVTPSYLWAARGQLQAVQYPASWYAVNDKLNADPSTYKSVFLPWHMYMYTNFAGRLIANPAPKFFDKPMLVSGDPEFGGAAYDKPTLENRRIGQALRGARDDIGSDADLVATLTDVRVRYVLLAKDSDYEAYGYLDNQPGLRLIADYPEIRLYRNENYK